MENKYDLGIWGKDKLMDFVFDMMDEIWIAKCKLGVDGLSEENIPPHLKDREGVLLRGIRFDSEGLDRSTD